MSLEAPNTQNIKAQRRQVNGILVIDKPIGFSSNQALQKVKRIFNAKKAGHTGSLDPLATGILPLCFGKATKVSQSLLDSDKKYLVTIKLGQTTTTGDAEGEILTNLDLTQFAMPSEQELIDIIMRFEGEQEQVPSMYSALKQNGVPLYKLARQGITVERKSRLINIYKIEIKNINKTNNVIDSLELSVKCSKGTYIRTLAEDLGAKIGCGAYVTELRRTAAGPYNFDNMKVISVAELEMINDYSELDKLLLAH